MKKINKEVNAALDYTTIIEDVYILAHNPSSTYLIKSIKEAILSLRDKIYKYQARIGRLKNEVRRLNKKIGELNGSSS